MEKIQVPKYIILVERGVKLVFLKLANTEMSKQNQFR